MLLEAGFYKHKEGKGTAGGDPWSPLQEPLAGLPEWQWESGQPH